jgi:hypothetical protein
MEIREIIKNDLMYCYGFDFFFKTKPTKKEKEACEYIVSKITPVRIGNIKVKKGVSIVQTSNCVTIMLVRGFRLGYEGDFYQFIDTMNKWHNLLTKQMENYTGWEAYTGKTTNIK